MEDNTDLDDIQKIRKFLSRPEDALTAEYGEASLDPGRYGIPAFTQKQSIASEHQREDPADFDEGADYVLPPSVGGSSYQQYLTSPSASFHSRINEVAYDETLEDDMDVEEEYMAGSQAPTVAGLYNMNKAYQRKIEYTLDYLETKLAENLKEQEFLNAELEDYHHSKWRTGKYTNSPVLSLAGKRLYGTPYFKDSSLVPAPPSRDQNDFSKAGVQSLTFHHYAAWSKIEGDNLEEIIYKTSLTKLSHGIIEERDRHKADLAKGILAEPRKIEAEKKVEELSARLKSLSNLERSFVLGQIQTERDWEEIARALEFDLNVKRTAQECRLYWTHCRHPSLYKTGMKVSYMEEIKMKAIIKDPLIDVNNLQAVCAHFPNRTEFWIFKQLRRYELAEKSLPLTQDEKELFAMMIKANQGRYFTDAGVAELFANNFPTISYHQLKALYNMVAQNSKAGRARRYFSSAEDMIILKGFEVGLTVADIARVLPHRKVQTIGNRYKKLNGLGLSEEYTGNMWNKKTDRALMTCVKKHRSKGWEFIQKNFFPNRTPYECQRRMTFLQYQQTYLRREKKRAETVTADLSGKFGTVAASMLASLKSKHYMRSFRGKEFDMFRQKKKMKQQLRLYLRPYVIKTGRQRSAERNTLCTLNCTQSRTDALIILKYLRLLRARTPKLLSNYNENPEILDAEPCSLPAAENFAPNAVKSHLVHLLATGEYAMEANREEPVPVPDTTRDPDYSIDAVHLPPTSQSLLLLRGLLLHREHLIMKCAKKPEEKPTVTPPAAGSSDNPGTSQDAIPDPTGVQPPTTSEAHAEAKRLLLERMSCILYWPARLATRPPPVDLKSGTERVTEEPIVGSGGQPSTSFTLGRRGGLVRISTTQKMGKQELKKLRSERMKERMTAKYKVPKLEADGTARQDSLSQTTPPLQPVDNPTPKPKRTYIRTGKHSYIQKVGGVAPRRTRRTGDATDA